MQIPNIRVIGYFLVTVSTFLLIACDDCCDEILRGVKIEEVSITSQTTASNTVDNEPVEIETKDRKDTEEALSELSASNEVTEDVPLSYAPFDDVAENNKNRQPLNLQLPSIVWEADNDRMSSNGVLPNVFRPLQLEQKMNFSGRLHWDESEAARELSVEESITGAEVELKFFLP